MGIAITEIDNVQLRGRKGEIQKIMKKMDLHIHTVSTVSDRPFVFSMEILERYVEERRIDVIAITNHNMFDLGQYREIVSKLPGTFVFPGIEINIGNNAGHLIVIARQDDVEEFAHKCEKVQKEIKSEKDSITTEQLQAFFGKLDRYLFIPHYDKKPAVDKRILAELQEFIFCGEVNSVKKFIRIFFE